MWGICKYTWLYVKVFSLESFPLYSNHFLSYSVYALSSAEGTAGPPGALTAQGPFMLRWVNDTPSVNGNTVKINLAIGPSYKSVMCRLIPRPFQNCKVTSILLDTVQYAWLVVNPKYGIQAGWSRW